jgi:hypothetical protein
MSVSVFSQKHKFVVYLYVLAILFTLLLYTLKLMNEHSLHSDIKEWYSLPGDKFEVKVDDFVIDVVRGGLLIEIQTRNFSAIKSKLASLVEKHRVRLVYPIPERKWILRITESGDVISRRKSPRKGKLVDLFYELVRIPELVDAENFSLEVLVIEEEEVRCNDGKGSWRRRGVSITDRRLINVTDRALFKNSKDFLKFLPEDLNDLFTNKMLARKTGISISLARKVTYCLRKMGAIATVGKNGKELMFRRIDTD